MSAGSEITIAEVNKHFVLAKCDYFQNIQLWPLAAKLDPERWLANFSEEETPHAVHLLHSFLYFSEHLIDKLFIAAFQSLSVLVTRHRESRLKAQASWRSFVDNVLITHVTGEKPSTTDSGHIFARKARDLLAIPEERILQPEALLQEFSGAPPQYVVLVDDFVGSGMQFHETWHRVYRLPSGVMASLSRIAASTRTQFFYCPLFCTSYALANALGKCQGVTICPSHIVGARHGVFAPNSIVWPESLRGTASNFLLNASERAKIPDRDGGVGDWRGFHKLGLTLAFSHSIPDATLPLFTWDQNGWKPLIRLT